MGAGRKILKANTARRRPTMRRQALREEMPPSRAALRREEQRIREQQDPNTAEHSFPPPAA